MTVQEAIDEVMNMRFAGGCGQYTKDAVLIVCAAAKHAIEDRESKKHLLKKREGNLITYDIDYLLSHLPREIHLLVKYKDERRRLNAGR